MTIAFLSQRRSRTAIPIPLQRLGRLFLSMVAAIAGASSTLAEESVQHALPAHEVLVIVGAPGEAGFEPGFDKAAESWRDACEAANATCEVIGLEPSDLSDRERIRQFLAQADKESDAPLWLSYIGHGTFRQSEALLNLRGPDLSAAELAEWLADFRRPLIVVHGGSASAPFIPALSGPNRIVISATRSADEINYARFGEFFARLIDDPSADLNQDQQTSLLEAFLFTAERVQTFYDENGRLASEHALIDDNGDAAGTPSDWFEGARVVKESADNRLPDGFRAHQIALVPSEQEARLTPAQRKERNRLEKEIETLRLEKESYPEDIYYDRLDAILKKLSVIYLGEAEKLTPPVESEEAGEEPLNSAVDS